MRTILKACNSCVKFIADVNLCFLSVFIFISHGTIGQWNENATKIFAIEISFKKKQPRLEQSNAIIV